jgi:hypothetical protein
MSKGKLLKRDIPGLVKALQELRQTNRRLLTTLIVTELKHS